MVEAALTLGLFLFLVLVGLDLIRLSYNAVSVQFLAADAIRQVVLGTDGGGTAGAEAVEARMLAMGDAFGLNLADSHICINTGVDPNCGDGTSDDAGEARDLVTVRIDLPVAMLFKQISYTVKALAVGRNEPFGN